MPPIRYREDLLDRYPQPLAATYARVLAVRDPALQHSTVLALFEALLKYVTAAALAQYLQTAPPPADLTAALANLHRPSLGHWAGLLRAVLTTRRRQGLDEDQFIFPELARLYTRPTSDLPATIALVRLIQGGSAATVALRQVFDLLVAQRNAQAHGAGAAAPDPALAVHMQAALEEILQRIPSLAAHTLAYVAAGDAGAEKSTAPHWLRLMGDRPRLYPEPLPDRAGADPLPPQRLCLGGEDTLDGAVPLHPLLVYVPACAVCGTVQVGVLNGVRGTAADVLCYGCGHAHTLPGFAAEVAAWLARYDVALPAEAGATPIRCPTTCPRPSAPSSGASGSAPS
jgi:hypothetical protein